MKATPNSLTPATPNFPGIMIDPATGRKCALQQDIFHGLGLQGDQVSKTGARIYQNRYYDLLDVLEARAKVGYKRGRKRGVVLTEICATIAAMVAGAGVSASLLSGIGAATAPVKREAVDYQGANVATTEELGFSGAAGVRKQWDAQKATAIGRISDLETLNMEVL